MIIKQPNGLYCIYSNIVDAFIACNLTKEDLFVELLSDKIMGIIYSIKRVDEKGVDPNLLEMIADAKKQQKSDIKFLEAFEKTFDQPVQQDAQETAKNIVNNLLSYLVECDEDGLLKEFQAFFENSNSD